MSERTAVVMALGAAAGARLALAAPLPAVLVVIGLAFALRWPWMLVVGVALLASSLSARAWAGLAPPRAAPVDGVVTLAGDPEDVDAAVRVEVRVQGRRADAWARGAAAAALRPRLAGEQVQIRGYLTSVPEGSRAFLARRHVAARITVREVMGWRQGGVASASANRVRRALAAGAESLDPVRRSLFAGLVLGDRRGQPPAVEEDFRAAGLTHLLAVSGQNVAFVLTLVRPLLSRLRLRSRLVVTLGVLAFFALVTRWEPSVLRACAMAAVAATAFTVGRPSPRGRVLALAATAVLLADPLLVQSVAFLLSVGASAGIIWLAGPIAARLPVPRWVAEPLAVTLAAQIGVAPVLVPVFGGMPVAAVPANLLAGPAAGPVMMWGLTGGLLAGVLPPAAAEILHLPTRLLVGWIAGVAHVAARVPFGELRTGHFAVLAAAAAVTFLVRSWLRRHSDRPSLVLVCVTVPTLLLLHGAGIPGTSASTGVRGAAEIAPSAVLWRAPAPGSGAEGVVVVIGAADGGRLIRGLRRAGVRRIDVLVATEGRRADVASAVLAVRRRMPVRVVLAPAGHRIRDARVPARHVPVDVGGIRMRVVEVEPRLRVEISRVASPP